MKNNLTEEQIVDYYASHVVDFITEELCWGKEGCKYKIDHQQTMLFEAYQELILAKEKVARVTAGSREILNDREKWLGSLLGIILRSCKGPGKSTGIGALIIHFMCFFGTDQLNLATAPKFDQICDILFRHIKEIVLESFRMKGKQSIPYQFLDFQKDRIFKKAGIDKQFQTEKCVMLARTSKASNGAANADALQGHHSPYQMFAIDEGWGIPKVVYQALTTTFTMPVNFAIIAGNPTNNDGYANDAWESKYWFPIQFTLDGSSLITEEAKNRIKDEYRNYPNLYRVFVDGMPPLDDEDTIMRFNKICDCMDLQLDKSVYEDSPVIITFDPGMGGDTSVVGVRQGVKFHELSERSCKNTDENTDFVKEYISIYKPFRVGIDNIGIGKGVYDNLLKDYPDIVRPVTYSEGATRQDRKYKNKRAELSMLLADKVNAVAVSLPDNMRLRGELNVIKLIKDKSIIQIIPKKDIRKAIGRSPGLFDVCAMSMDFDDYEMKEIKENNDDSRYRDNEEIYERTFMSA